VLACLHLKGLPYRIDPIVPFYGNDEFARLSPLRRVPVLIDGDVLLADSTVICEYLEERYPEPALLPQGAAPRARARWFEEYADTRLGDAIVWHLYNQVVIRRFVWGEAPDEALLRQAREVEIPQSLDYLESELPAEGTLFDAQRGTLSLADIALASFFRNAAFSRYSVDATRWPKTAAYINRVLGQPAFATLAPFETLSLRTPIAQVRDALAAAGAPISERSYGSDAPRRGVFAT